MRQSDSHPFFAADWQHRISNRSLRENSGHAPHKPLRSHPEWRTMRAGRHMLFHKCTDDWLFDELRCGLAGPCCCSLFTQLCSVLIRCGMVRNCICRLFRRQERLINSQQTLQIKISWLVSSSKVVKHRHSVGNLRPASHSNAMSQRWAKES
eukprot:SAG31_NODE_618_length_13513_cov_87.043164_1_plen_152_part_00